ncbi:MAG: hypothetical protein ACREFX_13655 [Opitutaceae bacterium]
MSSSAITLPAVAAGDFPRSTEAPARKALLAGVAGIAITFVGALVSSVQVAATSWLVGLCFWTAAALGCLLMIMLLHLFDASWATVLRRQFEHGTVTFKWLALLFVPLFLVSWLGPGDAVWGWMNLHHYVVAEHKTVAQDVDYWKKSGFLNLRAFFGYTAFCYALWGWMAWRLRRCSVAQDKDGDPRWTIKNRFTSGFGIPVTGLSLTAAAIYWIKSLEYHWFSTIFGVWYFADCMRISLALGVLIMLWLWNRGDFKGILNANHLHSIGQLKLAFTVFWGYSAFAQYFLIWNANVPEETFWYNEREYGDWWWIGMALVFLNFLVPFLLLLSYRYKVTHRTIKRIALWILATSYLDLCWNILPAIKDANGHARPFFASGAVVWSLSSMLGVGGICIWAYLRSVPTTKLIAIRDPRIVECLTHHDEA